MSKLCTDCKGRGTWQESTERDGDVQIVQKYCHTCQGRGFVVNDEDVDDFDLAGVGATEGDGDE